MQHRDLITMELESEGQTSAPQSRGRTNSKLKVLVRSHAMREEASPPRDPPVISPCIQLIASPSSSPAHSPPPPLTKPVVVLSPSISRGNSPSRSPTSTLVASPVSRSSPQNVCSYLSENTDATKFCTHHGEFLEEGCGSSSPKNYRHNGQEKVHVCEGGLSCKGTDEASHRRNRNTCECTNQTCTKCLKNHDRNINNNLSSNINNNVVSSSNTLTVSRATRGKLRQQSSSQGSFEGSSSNSPCLSRDSSSEQYTDTTGVDLEQFIAETLNRNAKDRALMLRIEQELVSLAKDKIKSHYKFPPMSSYQRMLVHRCAAYFGMDHNIESSGKCVVVNKTKCTRIPDIAFKEYVKEDIVFVEEPRRSILKRDSNSIEDYHFKSPDRQFSLENRRSKSFEEREEEYERARRRIFNREMQEFSSAEEFEWSEIPWSSTESDCSSRFRLLHTDKSAPRLLKVQSVETSSDMPRPCVAKSYSFGGYGGVSVLTRGDSVLSTHSAGPRLLTKQDSGASTVSWRLSPSSSGYKSQSQISESVTPSPTSTPNLPGDRQDSTNSNSSAGTNELLTPITEKGLNESQLVWAVTDIHNVPKGSIIINPQTGKPVKNVDGSIYHYDPQDPPPGFHANGGSSRPPQSPHKTSLPQKCSKECVTSPKKQRSRSSPSLNKKINVTNSATSPSLPFTPPLQHSRSMQLSSSSESVPNVPVQQYPMYGNNYASMPSTDSSLQVYQPPYIVYASYGVPVPAQYDGRIDPPQMPEVSGGYFITDSGNSAPQSLSYPSASPYWHQQSVVYPNPQQSNQPPPPQRFAVPTHAQPGSYLPPSFSSGYCPPQPPPLPPQNPQNSELVPIYSHQPVQVVYSTQQPTPPNQIVYPSHSIMYTQSPVYSNMMVPVQSAPYPQNPPTPSNSSTVYPGQMHDQCISSQQNFNQLTHSINQLSIGQHNSNQNMPMSPHMNQASFDIRNMKSCALKGNKFSTPKNFVSCSSQSSTGTSSPATTVVAGYCSNPTTASYRTPPETPPTQNAAFGYGPNFMPPMVLRQMSNVRASPPINRSSRSPTPASDISHMDRQRFSLPPSMYQGMPPYVIQNDNRMIQARGPPVACRQQAPIRPQNLGHHTGENKTHKNRKSRWV
uniref:R3H domain-containing protein n=1 Tax=Photinus pyralis TaxID=7054 RepID=A0A1Y1L854_PHOPY